MAGFDDDPLDLSLVEFGHELTKNYIFFRLMVRHTNQFEQQYKEQADANPEKNVLCPGIHPDLLVDGRLNWSYKP